MGLARHALPDHCDCASLAPQVACTHCQHLSRECLPPPSLPPSLSPSLPPMDCRLVRHVRVFAQRGSSATGYGCKACKRKNWRRGYRHQILRAASVQVHLARPTPFRPAPPPPDPTGPHPPQLQNDGTGDMCDLDMDGDGIPNGADRCPLVADSGLGTNRVPGQRGSLAAPVMQTLPCGSGDASVLRNWMLVHGRHRRGPGGKRL